MGGEYFIDKYLDYLFDVEKIRKEAEEYEDSFEKYMVEEYERKNYGNN